MATLWRRAALPFFGGALLVGGLCTADDHLGLSGRLLQRFPLRAFPALPRQPPPQLSGSPQVAFLWELCLPVPKAAPQREPMGSTASDAPPPPIPVLIAPRGYRKTTVASIVAKASNKAVLHLTREDLECKAKALGTSVTIAGVSLSLDQVFQALMEFLKTAGSQCIILDDVMQGMEPGTPDKLQVFLRELRRVAHKRDKRVLIITSNEGFRWCTTDVSTALELIEIIDFPAPSIPELTAALVSALQDRGGGPSRQAFAKVPPQVTPKLITEALVGAVAGQLPMRHGRSMRVWGLLLSQLQAGPQTGTPEAFREALMKVLHSPQFLLSVSKEVDLVVHQLSRVDGLVESPPMPLEDLQKLRELLKMPALAQPEDEAPLEVPGRLALLALLRVAGVKHSGELLDSLEEKRVQPKVRRLVDELGPGPLKDK